MIIVLNVIEMLVMLYKIIILNCVGLIHIILMIRNKNIENIVIYL